MVDDELREGHFLNLKQRKRKKKRKRIVVSKDVGNGVEDEEEESGTALTTDEVLLLKEAQRLRDNVRHSGLPLQAKKSRRILQATSTDEGFAAERAVRAEEERMTEYVEKKMDEKFGKNEEKSADGSVDMAAKFKDELYAIPEHLQVEERPMYDPDFGLPAAGVEEIDVPDSLTETGAAKQKNNKAHKVRDTRKASSSGTVPLVQHGDVSGNVSANYLKHRKDWIAANVIGGAGGGDGQRENQTQLPRTNNRTELATDAIVLEKFKKRWRK